ncbi:MAG: mechanosensitive ion channel family protein [Anaerolineales bacterium]
MNQVFWGLSGQQWIEIGISILILLAVLLLGRWVITLILEKLLFRITKRTKSNLDNQILNAARLPLYFLAVVLALDTALRRLSFLPGDWNNWLKDGFFILYFLVGFIFAWRLVTHFFRWYEEEMAQRTEANLDKQLFPFFERIVLILLSAVGIITILSYYEIDITAMVTTLGIGSLAVALAAKSTLEDTISGFMIMIDRPYRIGDRIELMDLDTWGDVVDIGLRSTRIRTRDNRMVIVPNSVIGKSLVVNYAYPNDQYRLQIHIGVAYGTEIEKARQVMIDAVQEVEGVLSDRPVEALFLEFGESTMIFRVRWWLESYVDTRRMFDRVNTALYNALKKENIQLPFPQLDVNLKSEKNRQ